MTGAHALFIRFVIHRNDADSGRRQGLFQALADLEKEGALAWYEIEQYHSINEWFRANLRKPDSFSRSSKPHAKKVALSWFKVTAVRHIRKMRELAQILATHDIMVHVLHSERPGYVVYEDTFQVAAEPYSETIT